MVISKQDKQILRELAKKYMELASLPVNKEKTEMWKHINMLKDEKPMVWINQVPWHEMDVNGELTIRTSNEFCRSLETFLRQQIYQFEHMRCDMVLEPVLQCPLVIEDTGFGITEDVDIVNTDINNSVVSRHFKIQIRDEEDLEKIKYPVVTYDEKATEENYSTMLDIFQDIIPVEKSGMRGFWFAPWDELVRWWGIQEVFIDMYDRPELVNKAMARFVDAWLRRLEQYEKLNLLDLNNINEPVGSGAYGYTDELPGRDNKPEVVRPSHLWGSAAAQIFSDVSPRMHEEFALSHEIRWLERFGLTYYGCCEPLHRKIHILEKIPNLRKISMSRWINVDEAVSQIGRKYVFSYKPNPAVFAYDVWNPDEARAELETVLKKAKGCIVEIIMKDISTVRYEPQRLWEWAKIAEEVTNKYA